MCKKSRHTHFPGTSERCTKERLMDDQIVETKQEEMLRLGAFMYSLKYDLSFDLVHHVIMAIKMNKRAERINASIGGTPAPFDIRNRNNDGPVVRPYTAEDKRRADIAARAAQIRKDFLKKQRTTPLYGLLMANIPWSDDEAVIQQDRIAQDAIALAKTGSKVGKERDLVDEALKLKSQ